MSFQPSMRPASPMSLTFSTPAENLYADPTPPTVAPGVGAPVQSVPLPHVGAVVYRHF
jgi:hypothetical protein